MNQRITQVLNVLLCNLLMVVPALYADALTVADAPLKKILVEIDYGNNKPSRTIEHAYKDGDTALEVLQAVANVETRLVGIRNIVVVVDGVEGVRGDMGWYYKLDGESPKQIAATLILDGTKSMSWIYKTDVCSDTVDK